MYTRSLVAQVHRTRKLFFESSGACSDQVLNLSREKKFAISIKTSRQSDLCLISGGGDLFH